MIYRNREKKDCKYEFLFEQNGHVFFKNQGYSAVYSYPKEEFFKLYEPDIEEKKIPADGQPVRVKDRETDFWEYRVSKGFLYNGHLACYCAVEDEYWDIWEEFNPGEQK